MQGPRFFLYPFTTYIPPGEYEEEEEEGGGGREGIAYVCMTGKQRRRDGMVAGQLGCDGRIAEELRPNSISLSRARAQEKQEEGRRKEKEKEKEKEGHTNPKKPAFLCSLSLSLSLHKHTALSLSSLSLSVALTLFLSLFSHSVSLTLFLSLCVSLSSLCLFVCLWIRKRVPPFPVPMAMAMAGLHPKLPVATPSNDFFLTSSQQRLSRLPLPSSSSSPSPSPSSSSSSSSQQCRLHNLPPPRSSLHSDGSEGDIPSSGRRHFISGSAALSCSLAASTLLLPKREALSEELLSEWEVVPLPVDPGVVLLDLAFVPDEPDHGHYCI